MGNGASLPLCLHATALPKAAECLTFYSHRVILKHAANLETLPGGLGLNFKTLNSRCSGTPAEGRRAKTDPCGAQQGSQPQLKPQRPSMMHWPSPFVLLPNTRVGHARRRVPLSRAAFQMPFSPWDSSRISSLQWAWSDIARRLTCSWNAPSDMPNPEPGLQPPFGGRPLRHEVFSTVGRGFGPASATVKTGRCWQGKGRCRFVVELTQSTSGLTMRSNASACRSCLHHRRNLTGVVLGTVLGVRRNPTLKQWPPRIVDRIRSVTRRTMIGTFNPVLRQRQICMMADGRQQIVGVYSTADTVISLTHEEQCQKLSTSSGPSGTS